jgi:PilX N-terminal
MTPRSSLKLRTRSSKHQQGLATLVVVMLLFFVVALVAAYANRNLIFEQRTSANQYRSSQALEAAEAGMQWTLAMLNAGRIDNACKPVVDETQTTFRARVISTVDEKRQMSLITSAVPPSTVADFVPRCTFDAASTEWTCLCAGNNLPAVAGNQPKPFFRIRFETVGCTRPDVSCLSTTSPQAPDGDAMAAVTSLVTLRTGLSAIPGGPVTAEGDINAGGSAAGLGPLTAINNDPGSPKFAGTNGITFIAGGTVGGYVIPVSLPGQPGNSSLRADDPRLQALTARVGPPALTKSDRLFSLVFGMWPNTYQSQPNVVLVPCAGGCTSAAVNALAQRYPGNPLWVNGNLTVNGNIGSLPAGPAASDPTTETLAASEVAPTGPVVLIVNGNLTLTSGAVVGLLYHRAPPGTPDWNLGLGNATIRGALVTEGNILGAGAQTVTYDAALLNRLQTRVGAYVRVPGAWRDF